MNESTEKYFQKVKESIKLSNDSLYKNTNDFSMVFKKYNTVQKNILNKTKLLCQNKDLTEE